MTTGVQETSTLPKLPELMRELLLRTPFREVTGHFDETISSRLERTSDAKLCELIASLRYVCAGLAIPEFAISERRGLYRAKIIAAHKALQEMFKDSLLTQRPRALRLILDELTELWAPWCPTTEDGQVEAFEYLLGLWNAAGPVDEKMLRLIRESIERYLSRNGVSHSSDPAYRRSLGRWILYSPNGPDTPTRILQTLMIAMIKMSGAGELRELYKGYAALSGIGTYFTPEDIETVRAYAHRLMILRTLIPGVILLVRYHLELPENATITAPEVTFDRVRIEIKPSEEIAAKVVAKGNSVQFRGALQKWFDTHGSGTEVLLVKYGEDETVVKVTHE